MKISTMKISDIWNNARHILENFGIDNSSEDALVLLAYCWWKNIDRQLSARISYLRVQIAAGETVEDIERKTQTPLSPEEYQDLIDKRARHIPLQILTKTSFFGQYEFCVGPGVFIPRPETEEMVMHVIENVRHLREKKIIQLKKEEETRTFLAKSSLMQSSPSQLSPSESSSTQSSSQSFLTQASSESSSAQSSSQSSPAQSSSMRESSSLLSYAPLRILDLCAGSGAIGITMALELPEVIVDLVEISPQAHEYMKKNSDFYQSSFMSQGSSVWCDGIRDACDTHLLQECEGNMDVIISNPPYLPTAQPVTQKEAQYDPEVALYGGSEDGLDIPFRIIDQAVRLLRPGKGYFAMECDPTQAHKIKEYAQNHHLRDIRIHQDFTHRDRWITAYRDESHISCHSRRHATLSDYENVISRDSLMPAHTSMHDFEKDESLENKNNETKEISQKISQEKFKEDEEKVRTNHATCAHLKRARFYIISNNSYPLIDQEPSWKNICLSIEAGNLLVVPTDTVYGVACCAYNMQAIEKLYQAKQRPHNKALPLVMTMKQLGEMIKGNNPALWNPFLQLSPLLQKLAYHFLPGALTLIARSDGEDRLHKRDGLYKNIPSENTSSAILRNYMTEDQTSVRQRSFYEPSYLKTVSYDSSNSTKNNTSDDTKDSNILITQAIRVPDCPVLLKLLEKTGPLACSSANLSGKESPITAQEAYCQLGDTVDWYIDGGPSQYGQPSTIVADDGNNNIRIVREGAISRQAIYEVLGLSIS